MNRSDRSPLLLAGDALTLALLLAGGLFAYLSAYLSPYGLPEDRQVLLAVCVLSSALSAGLWSRRRGGWAALGLLCAGGAAVWGLWDRLGPAFRLMESAVSLALSGQGAGVEVLRLNTQEWQAGTQALTPALLVLSPLLALGLGWIVVWARAWYLAALAVTVPVLPAILAGILPDWTALTASAAGWGTLLLGALYNFRDKRRLGRGVLVNLAGMCALLAVLTAALPREGYRRPQWATDARDNLVTALVEGVNGWLEWDIDLGDLAESLDLNLPGGSGGGSVGDLDSGAEDLLRAGPRHYSGRTVLTVKTDQPDPAGRIYLRGGSAAVYTGERWETADPVLYSRWMYAGGEASFPGGSAPEEAVSHMTIRYSRAGGGAAFYPYFPAGGGLDVDADGLAARTGQTCEVDYVPLETGEGLAAPGQEEGYRSFVYQQYLDVPDRARRALDALRELSQGVTMIDRRELPDNLRRVWTAQQIGAALALAAYYDPSTPAMEPGEDFVEQFLREGRGYCVHFATAGTLLLRMQGIPARYVTGYTALLDRYGRATVADSAAHAWVEIYIDGFGWYPVEMTPGYQGTGGALAEHPAPAGPQQGPAAGGQAPPVEDEEDNTVDPEDRNHPEEPEEPEEPGADEPPAGESGDSPAGESVDLTLLKYLLLAAAAAALPGLAYWLAARLRQRSRTGPDTNRSVIDAYLRCQRVLRWGVGEADPRLEELAGKARFSQHRLTEEERASAWARLEEVRARTEAALPAWKYWILRAIRPLL